MRKVPDHRKENCIRLSTVINFSLLLLKAVTLKNLWQRGKKYRNGPKVTLDGTQRKRERDDDDFLKSVTLTRNSVSGPIYVM